MSNRIKELEEKRGQVRKDSAAILAKATAEKRELNGEEINKVKELRTSEENIGETILAEHIQLTREAGQNKHKPSDQERKDVSRFSLTRFLSALGEHRALDGIEKELADEGEREAREAGISRKGTMVSEKAFRKEYRDFTATGGSSGDQGGNTIQTNKAGLLDSLFDENVLAASGATVLTGLVGNLDLPRIVAGTKPAKKAENAQADEYTATTALLSLTPKRLPTVLEVSSQLLKQTSPSVDAFLQNHIRNQLLNVMEIAHINGGGTSEPTGILSGYDSTNNRVHAGGATVVGTNANGAAPVYNDFVRLASKVQIANALRGSLAYLINGKVEFAGKTTARIASTDSMMIIDDRAPGRINGFGYKLTNAVPSTLTKGASGAVLSAAIFGNFADYVIAQWGGIEFLVNPYTKDDLGLTRINAVVFYDGGVVRPASFAACVDMVAAV